MAIFRGTYPEDVIMEGDQNYILEELARVFYETPLEEPSYLNSYRWEGGALIYVCTDQQSGQWFVKASDNHRMRSGARLKATNAKILPKPVEIALRTRDTLPKTIKNY
jgi:hypothetical protein